MNGTNINWLQISYPVFLWSLVALCAVLACANVVISSANRPARSLSIQPVLIVSALDSNSR